MRRNWIGWIIGLGAAALLMIVSPYLDAPGAKEQNKAMRSSEIPSPQQEQRLKMAALHNDMEATALLCTTQCSRKMKSMITSEEPHDTAQLKTMLQENRQMKYAVSIQADNALAAGQLPASLKHTWDSHYAKARAAFLKQKDYASGSLERDGKTYAIIGVSDPQHSDSGLIALLDQSIVTDIERQQRRNLRLVPFPAEGNYRMESVQPGSMKDTTVKIGEDNANASHYYTNEVVVHFKQEPDEGDWKRIRQEAEVSVIQQIGDTHVLRSRTMNTQQLMAYFLQNWQPEYVEPHYLYLTNTLTSKPAASDETSPFVPNDVLYSDYQWNLPSIQTELGWNVSRGSEEVIVAVLDTGVQSSHPDLQERLVTGLNVVNPEAAPEDDVGHGTHVAGIISASVNNGEGVAGMSWYNKIMPIKVLDGSGAGTTYSVAQGIIWATDHGAKIINLSLGNYASAQFLHDAIRYAYDHDVVLIAASGNDNTERPGYPAAYPEVLAVAATDYTGRKASFSNYGEYIDVAAPGASIASTYPGSQYAAMSGTSMACPHAAALAALIRTKNPELTNVEVMDIIRSTSNDLGARGRDKYFGYGQIDVARALEVAIQDSMNK